MGEKLGHHGALPRVRRKERESILRATTSRVMVSQGSGIQTGAQTAGKGGAWGKKGKRWSCFCIYHTNIKGTARRFDAPFLRVYCGAVAA